MSKKAIFLDKDGTLITNVPYSTDPNQILLCPGAGKVLRQLAEAGYELVVVSNQSGVARGYYPEDALRRVEKHLRGLVCAEAGVDLAGFFYCPHHPDGCVPGYSRECPCRKPKPGMLLQAAREMDIDLRQSWMIGAVLDDIEAGRRAGCHTILVNQGNETEWCISPERQPHFILSDLEQAAHTVLSVWTHQGVDLFSYEVE